MWELDWRQENPKELGQCLRWNWILRPFLQYTTFRVLAELENKLKMKWNGSYKHEKVLVMRQVLNNSVLVHKRGQRLQKIALN